VPFAAVRRISVVRKKNFGSQIGRFAPTLITDKAENVDQSDSSDSARDRAG